MKLRRAFAAFLLLLSLVTNSEYASGQDASAPKITVYGSESASRDEFNITLMKPDAVKINRIEVVSARKYVFDAKKKTWNDPGLSTPSEEVVLTMPRHTIDFGNNILVYMYKGKSLVAVYTLNKRSPYGEDYLDFYCRK